MQKQPYTIDTSDDALAIQLEGLRQMAPTERVNKMCMLSANLRRMAMDAIRRRHPEYEEREVRIKFIELAYGKGLADSVRTHLKERKLD